MTRQTSAESSDDAFTTAEARTRPAALVELIATVVLALSTIVAATAVSIGIARADVLGMPTETDAPMAIALLIGLLLLAMGGLTAAMARSPNGTA